MAEAITEMIIPGTYIEVRAEGLIGVVGIAVGNVGIVGTASKGQVGQVKVFSAFSEARDAFGDYDGWQGGDQNELTLVRALQQVFANGASTVYAVRCAASGFASATRPLRDDTGVVVTLTANTPGTWAQDVVAEVKAASVNGFVEERRQTVPAAGTLEPLHARIAASPQNVVRVIKGDTGRSSRFVLVATGSAERGRSVLVDSANGTMTFHDDDKPAAGDMVVASYEVDKAACRDIVLTYRSLKETYTVVDAADIKRDVERSSALVGVTIADGAVGRLPNVGGPLPLSGGANGEAASPAEYATALAILDNQDVNLAVLAGQSFKNAQASLLAHLETAENNGRDRMAVVGADKDDVPTVRANAGEVSDDRLILVAPGIRAQDVSTGAEASLNPAYAAAAVAGLIASLAVQVSPTNKVVRVNGLTRFYNDGELKQLLSSRVMPLERKDGFRVVKGITTDAGPFRQVSVRRIVDFAKAGTRIGSQPYIGRLNNARVRGALKATLNGFLSDMVLNEALTEFTLDVTATREQEIAGVALVTMLLKPTFSIDFIKVIMNLS